MSLVLESPVREIFEHLATEVYDPKKGLVNWGHDDQHIKRMLAGRRKYWTAVTAAEPEFRGQEFVLDLGILFHDLDRSKELRGRTDEAKARRTDLARSIMRQHGIGEKTIADVIEIMAKKPLKTGDSAKPPLSRLLDDLDKADMGAVGICRMMAVACDRGYGIFARARDFDPDAPAIEGDENLDSFAADICFCLEWWSKPKFQIETRAIRTMVRARFIFMKTFLEQLKSEHGELGLI